VIDDFQQSERQRFMLKQGGFIISLDLVGVLEVRGDRNRDDLRPDANQHGSPYSGRYN